MRNRPPWLVDRIRFASADALWDAVTAWAIPAREIRLLGTVVRACRPAVLVPSEGLLSDEDVLQITGTA